MLQMLKKYLKKRGLMLMPISKKITEQIFSLTDVDDSFKELMLAILEIEDKGTHRYKEPYDKLINNYLIKKEGNKND